jgi:hypothetical protein
VREARIDVSPFLGIAQRLVNDEVAIVLNMVVQMAPVISFGIAGAVDITGDFSRVHATTVAASNLADLVA